MKRIAWLLVLVAACKTVPVITRSATTGAAAPQAAVEQMIAAATMQDIQALGAAFGDEKGALRDHTDRAEMEKRAVIMLACMRHDTATISAMAPGIGGHQTAMVELTQGKLVASSQFTVAKGPGNRWYVSEFDITTLQNKGFCGKP